MHQMAWMPGGATHLYANRTRDTTLQNFERAKDPAWADIATLHYIGMPDS